MQVTFLGYFAGCVDHNNMPVVSGDDKEEAQGWRRLFKPGPEPVQARVLVVDHVNKVSDAVHEKTSPYMVMRQSTGVGLGFRVFLSRVARCKTNGSVRKVVKDRGINVRTPNMLCLCRDGSTVMARCITRT